MKQLHTVLLLAAGLLALVSAIAFMPTAHAQIAVQGVNGNAANSNGQVSMNVPNADLIGTTGAIGGGLLTAATCTSGTANVTGATTAMTAMASPVTYPGDGAQYQAYVSSSGVVTVKVCALLVLTPVSTAYNVRVIP